MLSTRFIANIVMASATAQKGNTQWRINSSLFLNKVSTLIPCCRSFNSQIHVYGDLLRLTVASCCFKESVNIYLTVNKGLTSSPQSTHLQQCKGDVRHDSASCSLSEDWSRSLQLIFSHTSYDPCHYQIQGFWTNRTLTQENQESLTFTCYFNLAFIINCRTNLRLVC